MLTTEVRKLLTAQIPADFADWLDYVAIGALLAFSWKVDPVVFAFLAIALGLPYLIVGPVAGVLVDRIPIRSILIWSNLGRGLATALLFLAPDWPLLLAFVALRSSVDTFFTPGKQSAIQALVPPDARTRANAVSHGINQASKIVAPSIGGGLLILVEPGTVFVINAGVSLLAALILLRMRPIDRAATASEPSTKSLIATLRAGIESVAANATLRAAILMMAAGYFAMFFYDTLIAPLTRDLGFSQTELGFALAAVGAGGVLGSTLMAVRAEPRRPFLFVALGTGVSGVLVSTLGAAEHSGASPPLALFLTLFFMVGICSALSVVPFRTIIQNHTSEKSIGQITALSEAANTLALLVAPFLGAWIAAVHSIGAAFIAGGGTMICVAIWAVANRNRR